MKVALVHEWLVDYSGSERVVEQILQVFPQADLFCVVDFLPEDLRTIIGSRRPTTTFIQNLPFAKRHYRAYLPVMPLAIEQLDVSDYDLVISSNHAVAKGVITSPNQLHLCYVHSPMRYAWDMQHQYLRQSGLATGIRSWLARWQLHKLRLWDAVSANRVDAFATNSAFIARRVEKIYRRNAEVIYPPVDLDLFQPGGDKDDFYLAASRLVPYKRVDVVVAAFRALPHRRLIVIGDGPEAKRVRRSAGDNVTFLGFQPAEVLRDHMRRARAFVFAAEEDFGIMPLEAQACGTPVIALGRGGAIETVRGEEGPNQTGVYFHSQTAEAVVDAIQRFESLQDGISSGACRDNAMNFRPARFRQEFRAFVERHLVRFHSLRPTGNRQDMTPLTRVS